MLPTPGLSAGSCVRAAPKEYSIAINGTVASARTTPVPPGETRRWILSQPATAMPENIVIATQALPDQRRAPGEE
jgi:hypothetical protein